MCSSFPPALCPFSTFLFLTSSALYFGYFLLYHTSPFLSDRPSLFATSHVSGTQEEIVHVSAVFQSTGM